MLLHRRTFLTGLGALIAAPAIVRVASLMPVRGIVMPTLEESMTLVMSQDMYAELAAVTRKAFVPRLFVQIYETDHLYILRELQ